MRKIAIFVEGQTEQIFIEKLLIEAARKRNISIEKRQASGGQSAKRRLRLIEASAPSSSHRYLPRSSIAEATVA